MATAKQIEANRRNAQKSTGPKTLDGKAAVSQNALQHGLRASPMVCLPEEQEEYEEFVADMFSEWQPSGMREKLALDRLIDCSWRLRRVPKLETALLLRNRKKRTSGTNQEAASDTEDLGEDYLRTQMSFTSLSRYERQLERSCQTNMRILENLQYARSVDCHPYYTANMRKPAALDLGQEKQVQEGHFPHPPVDQAEVDRRRQWQLDVENAEGNSDERPEPQGPPSQTEDDLIPPGGELPATAFGRKNGMQGKETVGVVPLPCVTEATEAPETPAAQPATTIEEINECNVRAGSRPRTKDGKGQRPGTDARTNAKEQHDLYVAPMIDLVRGLVQPVVMEVNIHQAKTHLSRLLERVVLGEEIIISKAGQPIARLAPLVSVRRPRKIGSAAGQFQVPDDFDAPLPPEIEESFWK